MRARKQEIDVSAIQAIFDSAIDADVLRDRERRRAERRVISLRAEIELPNGTILGLYEAGQSAGEKSFAGHNVRFLTLARFNLEWLTDGKDSITSP